MHSLENEFLCFNVALFIKICCYNINPSYEFLLLYSVNYVSVIATEALKSIFLTSLKI